MYVFLFTLQSFSFSSIKVVLMSIVYISDSIFYIIFVFCMQLNNKVLFGFLVIVTLTLQGCSIIPSKTSEVETTTTGSNMTGTTVTTGSVSGNTAKPSAKLNGTFHLVKGYPSPGGPETMDATVVIKDDIITAVSAKNVAIAAKSKFMQDKFIEGIAGQIVGKNIKDVQVSHVNGSSLTAKAFNDALHALY